VAGDRTDSLTVIVLDVSPHDPVTGSRSSTEGRVELQTRLDIKGALTTSGTAANGVTEKDSIQDIQVSDSDEMLLIRSRQAVVVYHLDQERVIKVIPRPGDVPDEFRLPQSAGRFTSLEFTQAHFTADSKVGGDRIRLIAADKCN
jgi:hypothetical protein